MAGYIEDRWLKKRPDKVTKKRERTARWGKGKRWRVAGIPGVRDCSFDTLDDAKTWKDTAATDSRRFEFIDPRLGEILLGEYIETVWWPGRSDAVGTAGPMRSKIKNHILPHLGHLQLNQIDEEALRLWLATLRRKPNLSEGTIEIIWIHLTSILKTAVGKRISKNPCSAMADERPQGSGETKARAWTPREWDAIRENLADWYRIAADLGGRAGLRQGEAFGFSPDDLDEDAEEISLVRQLRWDAKIGAYFKLPKGDKERRIPASRGLMDALRAHAAEFPSVKTELPWLGPGNGNRKTLTVNLLITTWFFNPVNPTTFNRECFKPALSAAGIIAPKDAGLPGWGYEPSRDKMFHRFRHTYASVQLRAGEDIVALSQWMGHASPDITWKTYAHFIPDDKKRGRTAVDAWLDAQR